MNKLPLSLRNVGAVAISMLLAATCFGAHFAGATQGKGAAEEDRIPAFSAAQLAGAPGAAPAAAAATAAAGPPNVQHGQDIFTTACSTCHGETGQGAGGLGGPALTHTLTRDAIVTVVTHGRNQMPAFGSALDAQDLNDLVAYVLKVSARR